MPRVPGKYSEDDLQAAVVAVQDRKQGIRSAAKEHKVPESTLRFRLSDEFQKSSLGPPPVLTHDEEETLAKWLVECSKRGFPKTSLDLKLSVEDFLTANPRPNPFQDNYPGRGWVKGFFKRHPELTERKPEAVSQASACVSEKDIRGWFLQIEDNLREAQLLDILKDPSRMFNGDETGFLLCVAKHLVIALKGEKNVYDIDAGEAKAAITVMFTFSAAGALVPPMLIYPYQRIPAELANSVPNGWSIGRSESGWMTSETFYEYIANTFNDYLNMHNIQRPVIYFVDGHKTHLTLQVSTLCSELEIILVALYPNATRILQPADVGLFFPMKQEWKKQLTLWRKNNPVQSVTKLHVAPILQQVLHNKDFSAACISGFKATGLYPWDVNRLDFSKCLGKRNDAQEQGLENCAKEETVDHRSLSFLKFCSIVGEERVAIFRAMEANKQEAEENILYQVWLAFSSKTDVERAKEKNGNEKEGIDRAVENDQTERVESGSDKQIGDNVDSDGMKQKYDNENIEVPVEISDEPGPSTSGTTLKKHLDWPEPPKRKGVRNIERMPFVISSGKYQDILKEKARKKTEEEAQKEARKRKRDELKIQKEEEKKQKEEQKRLRMAAKEKKIEEANGNQNRRVTRQRK